MNKTFYSHLVEVEVIEKELGTLDLSESERQDLLHHVHSSIHYKVLDVVLSELPEEHKKEFLDHLQNERHSEIWEHLLRNTQGVEEKIKTVTESLLSEFVKDIKMIREKHPR